MAALSGGSRCWFGCEQILLALSFFGDCFELVSLHLNAVSAENGPRAAPPCRGGRGVETAERLAPPSPGFSETERISVVLAASDLFGQWHDGVGMVEPDETVILRRQD